MASSNASSRIFELLKSVSNYDSSALETLLNYYREVSSEPGNENILSIFVNRRNEHRYSPLHLAIFARNIDAFKKLIAAGADINAKCHGTPCLHLALFTVTLPDGSRFGNECFTLLSECDEIDFSCKVMKWNLLSFTL